MPARTCSMTTRWTALRRAEDGTVAIIFGISIFMLAMVTGLALDVGRTMHANQKITDALDSAALAAAKSMRGGAMTDPEVTAVADRYFRANMDGTGANYAVIDSFTASVNRANNSVTVAVDARVPTIFARVGGIENIAIAKQSVAIYDRKDIEIGLQLDVTGSMAGHKLRDLKVAVGDLLDIVLPEDGSMNRVRVALAPYAAGVNAGSIAKTVSENRAAADGCVYERRDITLQNTDALPIGAAALKARSDLPGAAACPNDAVIQPLTSDKAMLKRTVNGYSARNATAGHLGTAWAWYLISPGWATVLPAASTPAAYNDGQTHKIAILMTDGIYNTKAGVSYRDGSRESVEISQIAEDTCTAMKARGIVVYTIGFQLDARFPYAADTLRDCASSTTNFYRAENGDQLRAAFLAIAAEINNLRLSH